VNSVGQLLEKSLSDMQKNLGSIERELDGSVSEGAHERFKQVFNELHQGLEIISSGVAAMRTLSSVVTHRLDEIHIVPKTEDPQKQ
jgi:hypothetical protein